MIVARTVSKSRKLANTVFAWLAGLLLFFPVFWTVLTSFKSNRDAIASPPLFLNFDWTLESYQLLWQTTDIDQYLLNSVVMSLGATFCVLAAAVPAAWSMAFFPSKWTKPILFGILGTKMLPAVALLTPVIMIASELSILDTKIGLIFILVAINLPIAVWMLFSFFRDIPVQILEASRMDGAGIREEIALILLPLAWPAIMSTFALCLILAWNESFWVLIFTATEAGTISAFLARFSNSPYISQIAAAATIAITPMIIIGWFCQKQIVRGLTFGAVT